MTLGKYEVKATPGRIGAYTASAVWDPTIRRAVALSMTMANALHKAPGNITIPGAFVWHLSLERTLRGIRRGLSAPATILGIRFASRRFARRRSDHSVPSATVLAATAGARSCLRIRDNYHLFMLFAEPRPDNLEPIQGDLRSMADAAAHRRARRTDSAPTMDTFPSLQ